MLFSVLPLTKSPYTVGNIFNISLLAIAKSSAIIYFFEQSIIYFKNTTVPCLLAPPHKNSCYRSYLDIVAARINQSANVGQDTAGIAWQQR
jgi:hypothetical protein